MIDYLYCSTCLGIIGKKSTSAARLWTDLCAVDSDPVCVRGHDIHELRILERLGFLVSTETAETVSIRLKGHPLDDTNEYVYCRGNHD